METTVDFKDEPHGKIFAEFNRPKNIIDPVIVSRYLPDNTKEQIGSIYSNYNEQEDTITFTCIDRTGRILFAPTTDYSLVEDRFEAYAKQLTIKAIAKQKEEKTREFVERIKEIQKVRNGNQKSTERER
jgi:hypothetical protein